MGFFKKRSEVEVLRIHIRHLDSELHYYKGSHLAAQERIALQKEQNDCLKTRVSLCEVILANILARNVDCIVGCDYYLERLEDIRSTDPDSNPPGTH